MESRKPGDAILDRYMPNASYEEREAARASLYRFVGILVRIALRELAKEDAIRANSEAGVKSDHTPV
jgi:hypothetical protein